VQVYSVHYGHFFEGDFLKRLCRLKANTKPILWGYLSYTMVGISLYSLFGFEDSIIGAYLNHYFGFKACTARPPKLRDNTAS
jgi:hypothetical protein